MERRSNYPLPTPEEKASFLLVGKRSSIAREVFESAPYYASLHEKSEADWLQLDHASYLELEHLARAMYEATSQLPEQEEQAMTVDFAGLVRHIKVMQGILSEYWEQGLSELFPPTTTPDYLNALCLKHDFFRFANVNGSLPLDYVDRVSDLKLQRFFPHSPAGKHLHSMTMITGVSLPSESPLPYILKLADTCGKPAPRYPETFFAPGGGHEAWIKTQVAKGALPFYAVRPALPKASSEEKFVFVDEKQYQVRDAELTLKGLHLLEAMAPQKAFPQVLKKVTDEVAADHQLVGRFGREG